MVDYIKGIDVSSVQGKVDYVAEFAAGIRFVIVKCGNGNDGFDPYYAQNINNAKAAGLKVATYHFIYPLPFDSAHPTRSPQVQAKLHFDKCLTDVVCIDCEWPAPQDFGKWNCNPAQLNQWMLDYLVAYEALAGKKPLVYTYPFWAAAVKFDPKFAEYSLWTASYEPTPAIPHPWTSWVLWQNTGGGGKLSNGAPVDTDLALDLSLWDGATPVAPPLPPIIIPVIDVPAPPPPVVVAPAPKPPVTHTPASTWVTDLLNFFANLFSKK